MQIRRWVLPFVLSLLLAAPTVAQVEPGQTFSARVTEVTDGDTFDVRRSAGGEVTIRLSGAFPAPTPPSPSSRTAQPPRRLRGATWAGRTYGW